MSLTAATATIMLSVTGLFPVPQSIAGFSADNVMANDPQDIAQTQMGVDGKLSGGFVFVEYKWNISLQADSPSVDFFEQWYAAQRLLKDVFTANGLVILKSINKKWIMTNGFLTTFPPMPDAGKILQPRRFGITWETVTIARV